MGNPLDSQTSELLQKELASIYQAIQQNANHQALSEIKRLIKKWPKNADVAHLAALVYKAINDNERAVAHFRRSLELNKNQPQAHNNLANLYKTMEQYDKAEKHYGLAITQQPNYVEARRNLALCYSAQKRYPKARKAFIDTLSMRANDVSTLVGLADCYREMGESENADVYYQKAIKLKPKHVNAWHNRGLNHHLIGELSEALSCYRQAHEISPNQADVVQSLASALHSEGSTEQAFKLFEGVLQNNPGNVSLHERYNELLWESDFSEQFCSSYKHAIDKLPNLLELRLSYIAQLFRATQIELAEQEVDQGLADFDKSHQLLSLKGQIQAEKHNYGGACDSLSESLAIHFDKDAGQTLTKIHIIQAEYQQGQNLLTRLFKVDPDCQLTWGLQSLVWRLTNDDRYAWLNNYDQLVRAYQMEVPNGYGSLSEYLTALGDVLQTMHRTERAPLHQTLRNGTQTSARLLHNPVPEIESLNWCLSHIVDAYIREMPDDPNHPLLSRKSLNYKFSGSWSVKLQPNGFHVNHVHPAGWISSAAYILIPDSMQEEDVGLQGSIKFGESPLALGEREVIEKVVKPEAGTVVLFPSYMWHGTYPFLGADNEFRLTSPFDVVPVK